MAEYVNVAIADATYDYDNLYTYTVPARLEGHIFVGSMVLVPFGRGRARPRIGVVIEQQAAAENPARIKALLDAAPGEDALSEEALGMVRYLKQATFCTWYEAVKTVVPRGARYKAVRQEDGEWSLQADLQRPMETLYRLLERPAKQVLSRKPSAKQQAVLSFLADGPKSRAEICENCSVGVSVAETLAKKGVLEAFEREKREEMVSVEQQPDIQPGYLLSEEQEKVVQELQVRLDDEEASPALLYGVTGSGKTAVFLELARRVLHAGKTCLILVPEIGLTPQMIEKMREVFGPLVAVQHSGLSATERYAQWQSIRNGQARVVVGTRSAVFAPLADMGLIVVDEEQERSYQSDASPRYDAIEVAKRRAVRHGALLLLASATPSVSSYHAACEGRYSLHTLAHRYGQTPLPAVEMVDMHEELMAGNPGTIGQRMAAAIEETIEEGKQVILLLNRRGYHRVGVCRSCGQVLKCTDCSVPMIYHRGRRPGGQANAGLKQPAQTGEADAPPRAEEGPGDAPDAFEIWKRIAPKPGASVAKAAEEEPAENDGQGKLLCHYCGKALNPAPEICPECGGEIRYTGFGTQRVEEELEGRFPKARVLRMDLDSTRRKGVHEGMLRDFGLGKFDILLGTQMVAKGLDFENVGLVGVIGIDSLLFSQGYRAFEHVFSLVTQVVGRAGRAGQQGRAMIQTMDPENPVLALAARQDYPDFYEQEIAFRKLALYPPLCSLCVVGFSSPEEADVVAAAKAFSVLLAEQAKTRPKTPLRILGPAPMHVAQVAGAWRWRLTLKCRADNAFRALLADVLKAYHKAGWGRKALVYVDFNPDAVH